MDGATLYPADRQPHEAEIAAYIASPLWDDLNRFVSDNYEVTPSYSYSVCSGQPGWNVKYRKAGRSLCTLYPMPGFFIALVVIGGKEEAEARLALPAWDPYTRKLFEDSVSMAGGRWLMISVTSERVLEDAKRLIQLRRKIKQKD